MRIGHYLSMLSYSPYCCLDQVFLLEKGKLLNGILFTLEIFVPVKIQSPFGRSSFLGWPLSRYTFIKERNGEFRSVNAAKDSINRSELMAAK